MSGTWAYHSAQQNNWAHWKTTIPDHNDNDIQVIKILFLFLLKWHKWKTMFFRGYRKSQGAIPANPKNSLTFLQTLDETEFACPLTLLGQTWGYHNIFLRIKVVFFFFFVTLYDEAILQICNHGRIFTIFRLPIPCCIFCCQFSAK